MNNYNYSLKDYSVRKALLWGNFREHAYEATQKGSLGHRTVHLIIAAAEILPIVGQIVSLAEMLLMNHLNSVQSLTLIPHSKPEITGQKTLTKEQKALEALKTTFARLEIYEKDKRIFKLEGEESIQALALYDQYIDSFFAWYKENGNKLNPVFKQFGSPLLTVCHLYQKQNTLARDPRRIEQVVNFAYFVDNTETNFLYAEYLEVTRSAPSPDVVPNLYRQVYLDSNPSKKELALEAGFRLIERYLEYVKKNNMLLTLEKLANLGHPEALMSYAWSVWEDSKRRSNTPEQIEAFRNLFFELSLKAANLNIHQGMNFVGYCYFQGVGVPVDNKVAFEWYQKASAAGNKEAQEILDSFS